MERGGRGRRKPARTADGQPRNGDDLHTLEIPGPVAPARRFVHRDVVAAFDETTSDFAGVGFNGGVAPDVFDRQEGDVHG